MHSTIRTEGGITNIGGWMDWYNGSTNVLSIYKTSDNHAGIRCNTGHIDLLAKDPIIQCVNNAWSAWATVKAKQFAVQSSIRYKTNVFDMTEERAKRLLKMRPVSYDYTVMGCEKDQLGLIAEEVAALDRYPVTYDEYDRPDSLDYSKFVPQLIKLCQLQQEEIDQLKNAVLAAG